MHTKLSVCFFFLLALPSISSGQNHAHAWMYVAGAGLQSPVEGTAISGMSSASVSAFGSDSGEEISVRSEVFDSPTFQSFARLETSNIAPPPIASSLARVGAAWTDTIRLTQDLPFLVLTLSATGNMPLDYFYSDFGRLSTRFTFAQTAPGEFDRLQGVGAGPGTGQFSTYLHHESYVVEGNRVTEWGSMGPRGTVASTWTTLNTSENTFSGTFETTVGNSGQDINGLWTYPFELHYYAESNAAVGQASAAIDLSIVAVSVLDGPSLSLEAVFDSGRSLSSAPDCSFDSDLICDSDDLDQLFAVGPIASGVPVGAGVDIAFDLTGDGVVDLDDRDSWLAQAAFQNGFSTPYQLGDANLDGFVDVSDFNIWNSNKFSQTLLWSNGNFNGDAANDVSDFNLWNSNKFTSSDLVPEPDCSLLLVFALLIYPRSGFAVVRRLRVVGERE